MTEATTRFGGLLRGGGRTRSQCTRCSELAVARQLCAYHYEKNRKHLHAAGLFESEFQPIGPVAEHVTALRGAGFGWPTLVRLTGLSLATLCRSIDPDRVRVSRRVSDMILAVSVPISPLDPRYPDGAQVTGLGTTRRLRALAAAGYPRQLVYRKLGMDPAMLGLNRVYAGVGEVRASRARAVADVYDELSGWVGDCPRTRLQAAERRWAPPLAWDDDALDNPDARPHRGRIKAERVVFAELVADYRFVGRTDLEIADLLGVQPDSFFIRLRRNGIPRRDQLQVAS